MNADYPTIGTTYLGCDGSRRQVVVAGNGRVGWVNSVRHGRCSLSHWWRWCATTAPAPEKVYRQKWDRAGVCWTWRSTVAGDMRATSYRGARTFTRLEWAEMSSKRP